MSTITWHLGESTSVTSARPMVVRAFVRQWMALPNDISIGYFHASISEGGLGIPSRRWIAPLHRKDRLRGLVPGRRMENITDPYLAKEAGADSGSRKMVQHTPPMRRLRRGGPLFCTNPSTACRSKTRIKSPANTNGWRMGPHFSQAETTLTATK